MQTFLPYPDFARSAEVLDRARLGKQRVECLQILGALFDPDKGWQNHPAVKMWRGHEIALLSYGMAVCDEWTGRGYRDTCRGKMMHLCLESLGRGRHRVVFPDWLGDKDFHRSHKSNLVRKNPDHYRQYFPNVSDDLPYIWPV